MRITNRMGALAFFFFLPAVGRAEGSETGQGSWDYRVEIAIRNIVVGHEPAKIVSDDSAGRFVAREHAGVRSEIRGRMAIDGAYLVFAVEPYTAIPDDMVRVNLAGVETYALAKLSDRVRVGLYHHSSHNFSDGSLGFGIDLNSFVLDADLLRRSGVPWGGEGEWGLRFLGHWFWTGRASPYVYTRATDVERTEIGETRWRAGAIAVARHSGGSAECSVRLASPGAVPSSLRAECVALFRLGPDFFGALGEHLFAGPYVVYGQNFSRTEEFGSAMFVGGLRVDLLFAEQRSKDPT